MWLFCFLILFMFSFFFFKCRYVALCFEHLTSHCTSWCWIVCFFCVLEDGSIGPEMELKRFRHFLKKQSQSQGTPSDKHLIKHRVIYWLDRRAAHPLSVKSMRQISHSKQITSLKVCMHSACKCNKIFMNDFFFYVCSYFSLYFKHGSVQIFICLCGGMHMHPSWFCLCHHFVCCRFADVAFDH